MKLVILPLALGELHDVAAFYAASANTELGLAFVAEFHRAVTGILANPLVGAVFRGTRRRYVLRQFPYSVFYQVTSDESDAAFKVFGGYRFDLLPIVSLSGEVGYRNLGKPNTAAAEYKVDGFDYGALAGVGVGPVELFAGVGGMQYNLDKTIGGKKTSFDGSAPVYGVGARFSLFGIGVRAEYEKINIDELDDVHMISVSAFYQF